MRRREFITVIAGATPWLLAVQAQQAERVRRIGDRQVLKEKREIRHGAQ
jgi:hypothetical protein